jgi:hypothetical protein
MATVQEHQPSGKHPEVVSLAKKADEFKKEQFKKQHGREVQPEDGDEYLLDEKDAQTAYEKGVKQPLRAAKEAIIGSSADDQARTCAGVTPFLAAFEFGAACRGVEGCACMHRQPSMREQTVGALKYLEEQLSPNPGDNPEDPELRELRTHAAEAVGELAGKVQGSGADGKSFAGQGVSLQSPEAISVYQSKALKPGEQAKEAQASREPGIKVEDQKTWVDKVGCNSMHFNMFFILHLCVICHCSLLHWLVCLPVYTGHVHLHVGNSGVALLCDSRCLALQLPCSLKLRNSGGGT